MSRRPLLQGTLALTAAGLYARVTGSVFRILLVRLVGEAGIGLFQMALPVLTLGSTLATVGLPGALATVVAERHARGDWRGVDEARRAVLVLVTGAAALTATGVWLLAGPIARRVLTDDRTLASLLALPPALLASSYGAVLRGYFHGLQDLRASAVSQVVEQTVRIFTVLGLASLLLPHGLHLAAAGAMLGIASGEAAGLGYLYWCYRRRAARAEVFPMRRRREPEEAPRGLIRTAARLLRLALPLMIGGLAASLTATFDVVVIPRRLQTAGLSWEEATVIYGQITGMALPVLFLPMVAVYSLATAITPAISAAHALGDSARLAGHLRLGIRLTLAISAAAALLFAAFPEPLARALYGTGDVAPLIAVLAAAAPVTYVQYLLSSTLIGLGETGIELRNYLTGLALRLALVYALTGAGGLGASGPLWAIAASQGLMALLHLVSLRRLLGRPRPA